MNYLLKCKELQGEANKDWDKIMLDLGNFGGVTQKSKKLLGDKRSLVTLGESKMKMIGSW